MIWDAFWLGQNFFLSKSSTTTGLSSVDSKSTWAHGSFMETSSILFASTSSTSSSLSQLLQLWVWVGRPPLHIDINTINNTTPRLPPILFRLLLFHSSAEKRNRERERERGGDTGLTPHSHSCLPVPASAFLDREETTQEIVAIVENCIDRRRCMVLAMSHGREAAMEALVPPPIDRILAVR